MTDEETAMAVLQGLALVGEYRVGDHVVSLVIPAPEDVDVNLEGDYFKWGWRGKSFKWHGIIDSIDMKRRRCIRISHMLGAKPDRFIAWYAPEEVAVDGYR